MNSKRIYQLPAGTELNTYDVFPYTEYASSIYTPKKKLVQQIIDGTWNAQNQSSYNYRVSYYTDKSYGDATSYTGRSGSSYVHSDSPVVTSGTYPTYRKYYFQETYAMFAYATNTQAYRFNFILNVLSDTGGISRLYTASFFQNNANGFSTPVLSLVATYHVYGVNPLNTVTSTQYGITYTDGIALFYDDYSMFPTPSDSYNLAVGLKLNGPCKVFITWEKVDD